VVGAASGVRHVAVGAGLGIAAIAIQRLWRGDLRPRDRWANIGALLVSCWGITALTVFYGVRYKDPFLWAGMSGWNPSVVNNNVFWVPREKPFWTYLPFGYLINPAPLFRSFTIFQYDGVLLLLSVLLALLGYPRVRSRLKTTDKMYWGFQLLTAFGFPYANSMRGEFWGFNRYLLLMIPLFPLLAITLRRSKVALGVWLVFSALMLYQVEICFHVTTDMRMGGHCSCTAPYVPPRL
jgi:hypothetical protein